MLLRLRIAKGNHILAPVRDWCRKHRGRRVAAPGLTNFQTYHRRQIGIVGCNPLCQSTHAPRAGGICRCTACLGGSFPWGVGHPQVSLSGGPVASEFFFGFAPRPWFAGPGMGNRCDHKKLQQIRGFPSSPAPGTHGAHPRTFCRELRTVRSTDDILRHQELERVPLADLHGYERNARVHSESNVRKLAKAIQTFGWTQPIIIDDANMIVAGHGRFAAAKSLGMTEVSCIRVRGMSPEQIRALVLSDNRIGEDSTWDERLLAEELRAINFSIDAGDLDIDLDSIGFEMPEIDSLMKVLDEPEPDKAPDTLEVEEEPVVCRTGETWVLGFHRLTVGGSEKARDADLLIRAWERETKEEAKLAKNGETFQARAAALGIEFVRPSVKSQKARRKG